MSLPASQPKRGDWAAAHRVHAERFLATRGLDLLRLGELVEQRIGGAAQLLLTSSPVHGLANETSDIDMIAVNPGNGVLKIATQIFSEGHHLEVIGFASADVDADLLALQRLAEQPIGERVAALRRWDGDRTLRRKYLERLVNGIEISGEAPYHSYLPMLAKAWMASSLDGLRRAIAFALLAERAGEQLGRLGYAKNAALSAMDVVLSHHGEVYSNRKWYLLRWRRWLADDLPAARASAELVAAISAAEEAIQGGLRGEGRSESLASPLRSLARELGNALELDLLGEVKMRLKPTASALPFLQDAILVLVEGTAGLLRGQAERLVVPFTCRLFDLCELDLSVASQLLEAARAGALEMEVWG
jgi:Family of unknown function (DUF6001)